MIKAAPAMIAALMLSACATGAMPVAVSDGSLVEGVRPEDRTAMVNAAVDLVRQNANPANNNIGIQEAPDAEFTPALLDGLRKAGYGVEKGDRLIYQIGPFGTGMMMRVSIDDKDATRLFSLDKEGRLIPQGPVTVRRMGSAAK